MRPFQVGSAENILLTAEQLRAARALLRWQQKGLSEASGVSLETVKRLESLTGALIAQTSTVMALQSAFEKAGIVFIEEKGVGVGLRLARRAKKVKEASPPKAPDTRSLARVSPARRRISR
jgi:hypothetical protein